APGDRAAIRGEARLVDREDATARVHLDAGAALPPGDDARFEHLEREARIPLVHRAVPACFQRQGLRARPGRRPHGLDRHDAPGVVAPVAQPLRADELAARVPVPAADGWTTLAGHTVPVDQARDAVGPEAPPGIGGLAARAPDRGDAARGIGVDPILDV